MAFDFEKELLAFNRVIITKLKENQHKSGWKNENAPDLIKRLKEETVELEEAILTCIPKDIAREAADVACFAMMIADVCRGLELKN